GSDLRDDDYKYWVNLLNTHADMKAEDKAGWNPNWTSAITLYGTNNIPDEIDTGYSLEWKINWSDWGISAPHAKDIWGLEISLNDKIWSVPTQTAWANTTSGDMDDPDGWGIALFCHEFQMDTLSWISEYSTSLFTGSVNNNVGQINCHAIGWDILQSLSIENLGTAKAGSEISSLKLWYQAGGGPFHPGNMQELGRFIPSGDKTWKLEGLNQQINNGDALYFTVDIQLTAQAESTCQFSLPKEEAVFQYSWPLEKTSLKNITSQVIQKQADFILDFIPLASVNLIPGVKNVNFGQIIINNVSGKDINLISLLTGLQDINYQDQNLDMVFERLWLKQGGETVKAIEAPFSSHGEFVFTPELKVANQGHITLELQGDIKEVPNLKKFRIGIPHNQSINRGQNILDPAEGKSFPILTGQVNIREPNLAATFSNFPNPFHAGKEATRISYCLESSGRVKIEVFNMHGARVIVLDDGQKIKGMYEVNWNGKNGHGNWVRNGVYLMRINVRYNNGCQEKLIRKVAVYR
ncbi:hypothetical protein KAR10_06770, partial [bacterium]|nr:hypothetical protein [bacterium]